MELCEHLKPYYTEELKLGNTVSYVGGNILKTGWKMIVCFWNPIRYNGEFSNGVEYSEFKDSHYDREIYIRCKKCKMSLFLPYSENEIWKYNPKFKLEHPRTFANDKTVITNQDKEFWEIPEFD